MRSAIAALITALALSGGVTDTDLCRPVAQGENREATPVPGDDRIAALGLTQDGKWLAGDHLVWWNGAAWRIQPLRAGRWPRYIQPKLAGRTTHGLELIAQADGGGSGGAGMLQLYRLGKEMVLVWDGTPSGDHLSVHPLSMELVITIDRSFQTYEEPHALGANCCLPADRETLWSRMDSRFRPSAERIIPNPYRAVTEDPPGRVAGG